MLPAAAATADSADTALGDWYVDRFVLDRRPLLLLVSSASLLGILVPARDVRNLPDQLAKLVERRLRRMDVAQSVVDAEVGAMEPIAVGRTTDRSVLGSLVDFRFAIPHYLPVREWDETTLPFVEAKLAHTPCRVTKSRGTIWPESEAPRLLMERWGDSSRKT